MKEKELPQMLLKWRKDRNFSQQNAAAHFGVAMRTYQTWELGKNSPRTICIHCLKERMEQP